MQRFRRLFTLLFILSLFAGVVHELNHSHHQGDVCEVCVLSHAPALLDKTFSLAAVEWTFSPFQFSSIATPIAHPIIFRSRSPPLV